MPDSFTLDIDINNNNFSPILLNNQKDFETSSNEISTPALPKIHANGFKEKFYNSNPNQKNYVINNNWYVALNHKLNDYLNELRKYSNLSISDRKKFLLNPNKYIAEELNITDELELESISSIFEETEKFLNERISYLGIWEPKSLSFKPSNID